MASCTQTTPNASGALQFWHTFNKEETAALQSWLGKNKKHSVTSTILPFAMANNRFRSALAEGACPDLVRIDATRVPGLVESEIIAEVPASVWQQRTWLSEAEDLVRYQDSYYGLPQSLDGLALIRKRTRATPWPFASLEQLEEFALRSKAPPSDGTPRLGILIDGYWAVAFLRAEGVGLPGVDGLPSIHTPEAALALTRFADWFRNGLTMDLLDERDPSRAMIRAFRNDEIYVALTGPWDLGALADGDLDSLEVSAFPGHTAPRGGQVLVVPRCSKHASEAWSLALALSHPQLQADWARTLGSIPVTAEGLSQGGRLANEFHQALLGNLQLPRHSRAPELFDDLTPAVLAIVGGDATAEEALAGVERAWQRLYAPPSRRSP